MALANTQIATAAAALSWMTVEWVFQKKPSVLGMLSGAVAGLVAITPAAGFVDPSGSLYIGLIAGAVCFAGSVWLKKAIGYDDSLMAPQWRLLGAIEGVAGAILLGWSVAFFVSVMTPFTARRKHGMVHRDVP
jgi:Amt family ammonium transporter